MVIKAKNAIELRKAKKAIEDDGFEINEAIVTEAVKEVVLSNEILDFLEERGILKRSDAQKVHKDLTAFLKEKGINEAVVTEANEMSFINKARAKSSLEQIKKGKRSDGMGKFDAKVYAIKGTQEIELTDPSDLAKYSVGYKYGLKNEAVKKQKSSLTETFIGPFVFTASTPNDELLAMYHGALDGYANYKPGMYFKRADYKLAYQTIEKILQKKGVAITEADDPEAGLAAPYGSGYSEVNEDAGMVIDVAMGVAAGLMGLWALVQSAPLVGRLFGDGAEHLANKFEKQAKMALKNHRKETIAPIIAKFKNDKQLADMYQKLTPYTQGLNKNQILDNKDRRKQLITIGKYIKSKLTPEEMKYFTDISAMLRDGDLK
jgi:hypothetical protein